MNPSVIDTLGAAASMGAAIWMLAKGTAVLAIGAIVHVLLRRRTSAATRHLVWSLAVAALLVLPLMSALAPRWHLPVRVAPDSIVGAHAQASLPAAASQTQAQAPPQTSAQTSAESVSTSVSPSTTSSSSIAARPSSTAASTHAGPIGAEPVVPILSSSGAPASAPIWPALFLGLYAIGVACLLARQALQWLALTRLARRAIVVDDPAWVDLANACAARMGVRFPVRLLRSREQSMPMAFGTRRPAILIPAVADLWTEDRREAVLLHELAHVARRDCLTQMAAATACALYWMHPGVWWVARRLRIERELACDDRVLTAGTQPREYAGHLLEIAYTLGGDRAPALAVSMARPRQLEGRMLAVLDEARNRTLPGLRARLTGATVALAFLLPLSGAALAVGPAADTSDPQHAIDISTDVALVQQAVLSQSALVTAHVDTGASPESIMVSTSVEPSVVTTDESDREDEGGQDTRSTVDGLPGSWQVQPGRKDGYVQLRLTEVNNSWGFSVPVDRLEGLTPAQRTGTGGPVAFVLRRDAGVFTFEGLFRGGVGGGTFTFTPDAKFPDALVKRGFARPTTSDQLAMARADVGFAFLDELSSQGYPRPELSMLVRAGEHGVGTEYLRGMGAIGYKVGALETLIKLRDHGVTPDYVRELGELGYKGLSAEQAQRSRDHGITPDYVREMRSFGYTDLTMEALIKARDHGISADYVKKMGETGFPKLPLDELIKVRDHGVTPEYAKEMGDLGYRSLSVDELVRARSHGVSTDYVREMAAIGFRNLPLDALIRARDHGVSADYAKAMRDMGYTGSLDELQKARDHGVSADFAKDLNGLGYGNLKLDELIGLRDHGVTADKIKRANTRAGTKLPLDMIRSMANGGMQ